MEMNLFDFLLGEKVEYVLKSGDGSRILSEKEGVLQQGENNNLIVSNKTEEVKINLNKAKNINLIEMGNYIEVVYAASTVEIRKSVTLEEKIDSLGEALEMTGLYLSLFIRTGNSTLFYNNLLSESFIYNGVINIETENLHYEIEMDKIVSIEECREEDELIYSVVLQDHSKIDIIISENEGAL